jgi:hypothetical protein
VTLLALQSSNIFDCYAIHFTSFDIVVKLLVDAVKLVSGTFCIVEIDFRFPVTVDTPAHAQFGLLGHFIHLLDVSMTGLTGYTTHFYVL